MLSFIFQALVLTLKIKITKDVSTEIECMGFSVSKQVSEIAVHCGGLVIFDIVNIYILVFIKTSVILEINMFL